MTIETGLALSGKFTEHANKLLPNRLEGELIERLDYVSQRALLQKHVTSLIEWNDADHVWRMLNEMSLVGTDRVIQVTSWKH
jgi:hypothetical protein